MKQTSKWITEISNHNLCYNMTKQRQQHIYPLCSSDSCLNVSNNYPAVDQQDINDVDISNKNITIYDDIVIDAFATASGQTCTSNCQFDDKSDDDVDRWLHYPPITTLNLGRLPLIIHDNNIIKMYSIHYRYYQSPISDYLVQTI